MLISDNWKKYELHFYQMFWGAVAITIGENFRKSQQRR